MARARAHVRVYGDVQGVFFRSTARGVADVYDVTGWIRNVPDGSVEAVFEGEEAAVKEMVAWCHEGPVRADVDRVDVEWLSATGEFSRFSIA
ncbi:MAG: acylphosphatase [Chloroflexi bacterium]|nr:acylphosphatase [Chloroflexota bacterium]MCL5107635.1 acylphosphatase [Chloroflexota bacterium]